MDRESLNSSIVADVISSAIDSAKLLTTIARPTISREVLVMGGKFQLTVVGGDNNMVDEMAAYLIRLESLWSRFDPHSEISELNNSEGASVHVHPETMVLVEALIDGWSITGGKFDPTTLPVTVANGFATSRIDAERTTVLPTSAVWPGEMQGIRLNKSKSTVTLPRGTTLDAGGIGKGLAADMTVALAMQLGATGAMVSANGDVVVDGESPDGNSWRIGIEHPLNPELEIGQVRLTKGAVVTSSRTRQVWMHKGADQHHLIDAATGKAARTPILSATVIASSGAIAEVQAKLPFVMDLEQSFLEITQHGSQVAAVDESMMMHTSSGWERYL